VLIAWGSSAGIRQKTIAYREQRQSNALSQKLSKDAAAGAIMAFQLYYVGRSTIDGAGLGVFASKDIPAGTLWAPEDAQQDHTLAMSL
jgi:hypothetical protein